MLAMVSGSFIFAPNPLDGLNFLLEPIQPLAATIVVDSEGFTREAVRPDALRVRRRAARLLGAALARRLGGAPADAAARGCADGAPPRTRRSGARARATAPPRWPLARPRRARPLLGGGRDARARRGGDRPLHGLEGPLRAAPLLPAPAPDGRRRPAQVGRLPRRDRGDAAADRDRHRDRRAARRRAPRCGSSSTAARRRSRAPSSRAIEIIAGAPEHRDRDVRARRLLGARSSRSCPSARPGRTPSSAARSSSPGRDERCSRCRSSSAPRARRCCRCPNHMREASLALGKTKAATIRARAAAGGAAGHRDRHRARHGPHRRRHGDRRSCCWATRC